MRYVLLLILLLVPAAVQAQTSEATRARLAELQRQLDSDRDRLRRALEAEQVTSATLDALDREVASRQALVVTYGMRLEQVRAERDSLSRTLGLLTNQFVSLRARQHALARQAYKRGNMNSLALLLSSRSVGELVQRVQYVRRIQQLKREHAARMQRSMQVLQTRQQQLATAERDATKTLGDATTEQQQLAESQQRRAVVVDAMRSQRGEIEARIARQQEDMAALMGTMRSVAREGVARRAASPEERATYLESERSFNAMYGRLPWPVGGVVTQGFGQRVDPVLGTRTDHPGIQIATEPGANVLSIFPGRVAGVGTMRHYGQFLVIDHGGFLSVYAGISALAVRRGDQVEAGQVIARAGMDDGPIGAALFFSITRVTADGQRMTDPLPWLTPR